MKTFSTLLLTIVFAFSGIAQSILEGRVTDSETGEPLPFANIVIQKNGVFLKGLSTDTEGKYNSDIAPGNYELKVSYIGYKEEFLESIKIKSEKTIKTDLKLIPGIAFEEVVVTDIGSYTSRSGCVLWGTVSAEKSVEKKSKKPKKEIEEAFSNPIVSLYPNPTVSHVSVKLEEDMDVISLISVTGTTLKTFNNPKEGVKEIDLSDLPAGIYLVQFQKESK